MVISSTPDKNVFKWFNCKIKTQIQKTKTPFIFHHIYCTKKIVMDGAVAMTGCHMLGIIQSIFGLNIASTPSVDSFYIAYVSRNDSPFSQYNIHQPHIVCIHVWIRKSKVPSPGKSTVLRLLLVNRQFNKY